MASHSPYGNYYGAAIGRSRSEGDPYDRRPLNPLAVSSTSPPCIPKLPAPTKLARPAPSILRNPLSPEEAKKQSHSPPSILKALPGRRRPSVVVEVVHSPPPPHFTSNDAAGGDTSSENEGAGLSRIPSDELALPNSNQAEPAYMQADGVGGMQPLSASPVTIPGARRTSVSSSSTGDSSSRATAFSPSASSVLTDSSAASFRSDASSVKFAPLPPGRRSHRSNSLSIGVASRAKMIQAQGGTPNVRTARYAGPQLWYEGGNLPEDVYTWKDCQKGLQKLFKRGANGKSEKGKEVAVEGDETPRPERGRSASVSSVTSSNDADEARRMELEAKGKRREIEHIEEADDEDNEDAVEVAPGLVKVASPAGPAPALYLDNGGCEGSLSDDEGTSASEVTSPRTPPEGGLQLDGITPPVSAGGDGDLDVELRRVMKGKSKAIDDVEHGEVRVAS
ncbi:hypothetical protein BMF94_6772 [Rhodotorula taiwanensis]|uniref:Uncharacterized protein n=1 Tax=Rhodotorula taiwanensis TaxID=741276 RepID=A0A2S5B087_9BASI|nr:hypothetical protein BMF94_6772 [Rhodotorula taiwanensis]